MSVVVPCYNYGRFLPGLVAGLLDQPGVDVEVIIVDDASPDGSGEVAERIADAEPRVRVMRHTQNTGHIRTYNDGLAAATGEYLVLLSADDLLPPGALTRAVALLEAHPNVGFVYGYARSFSETPPTVEPRVRSWSVWPGMQWLSLSARRGRCFIASPEVVMRRAAFAQTEGYDPRQPHSGDLDMWLRTAANWDVGRVNGPIQAMYRVHDAQMHLTTYAGWLTDLQARRTTFGILFDEREPDRPDVQRLRKPAMRALAREAVHHALVRHREAPDSADIDAYLQFAVETYPQIERSLRWLWCRMGPLAGRRLPAERLRELTGRVRHHLVWRRERRFGT